MKKFLQAIDIRFFDIDMNQHVNNSVYFTYMENARTELLMDEFLRCKKHGLTFVVTEATCRYYQPMHLGDKVVCEMVFELTRAVEFTVTYTFKNQKNGEIYAVGKTWLAMINEAKNRPVAIPKVFIDTYVNGTS
ncbi:acyl-CoA thioester hydrolase, YbgC/YbaW family [Saccharicrinis carchari]|uniref:Acyl-CoA thioester hydrolase, YbgC/YbaW family n=1 Tax=Saccharicrinis carchari TaxID=1168039 RepID=A0A521D317_SACCC|nr:thioesterase family protein [Saccharicrinis carchari]SMO66083.1 acyl-CoA thioester hydrolase, YbgC/YbaW family [Saccharicrinis carchari]